MLDFGEELTIETYKIPWVIWIQILVLLLLMILLYCFRLFSLDPSPDSNNSTASPSSSSPSFSHESHIAYKKPDVVLNHNTAVTHRFQPSQVGEIQSIKGEIATSTSRRILRGEDITERDSTSSSINYHPCHYFRLARQAFLRCLGLGLDSIPDNSSYPETKKDR